MANNMFEDLRKMNKVKFKDSDCYPILFDLRALIATDKDLVFPMVWHEKYYLKKVIEIDNNNIFILGRKLELEGYE